MADTDVVLTVRFDGMDADDHEIELIALGVSLQGIGRIATVAGNFAATQTYTKQLRGRTLKATAREPRAACFSVDVVWTFVQQHQLLSGSFGAILAALMPAMFAYAANRREEMKHLREALETAIRQLGHRDDGAVQQLLSIIDKMVSDMRPSVRKAVEPIGTSCRTLTLRTGRERYVYDEADKAEITKSDSEDIKDIETYEVLISELDLKRGTAKVHLNGDLSQPRVNAIVTDPEIVDPENPYANAFSSQMPLTVHAKALLRDGQLKTLYISDYDLPTPG